jgi:hypothetical protein
VLQAAVGEKAETYVNRRILAPLGAETEHWATDPEGFSTGGFRVNMTAREMAAFGLMMLDGGRNRAGQQIVPAWCVAECLRDGGFDYGLGWWIGEIADQNQRRWQVIYAWGWGGQVIYLAPGLGLVVVMTADTALDVWEEEPDHEALVRAIICATQQDNNDGDDRHTGGDGPAITSAVRPAEETGCVSPFQPKGAYHAKNLGADPATPVGRRARTEGCHRGEAGRGRRGRHDDPSGGRRDCPGRARARRVVRGGALSWVVILTIFMQILQVILDYFNNA